MHCIVQDAMLVCMRKTMTMMKGGTNKMYEGDEEVDICENCPAMDYLKKENKRLKEQIVYLTEMLNRKER